MGHRRIREGGKHRIMVSVPRNFKTKEEMEMAHRPMGGEEKKKAPPKKEQPAKKDGK